MGDPAWPKPPGLTGHTPWLPSHACPPPFLGKGEAPAVFSGKSSRGSCGHRRHGGPRPWALAGEERDLGGGDRGQGEGRGGIGPEHPVQQLLLLLLKLSPQLGLLLQGLAGEKQVLRELPVDVDRGPHSRWAAAFLLEEPTRSSRRPCPDRPPACVRAPTALSPCPPPGCKRSFDPMLEERGPHRQTALGSDLPHRLAV